MGTGRCLAGRWARIECESQSDETGCTGLTYLRACPEEQPCFPSGALAPTDLSQRPAPCEALEFLCEDDSEFSVWASQVGQVPSCGVRIELGAVPLTRPCEEDARRGPERMCGWSRVSSITDCEPGSRYKIGCVGGAMGVVWAYAVTVTPCYVFVLTKMDVAAHFL